MTYRELIEKCESTVCDKCENTVECKKFMREYYRLPCTFYKFMSMDYDKQIGDKHE